MAALSEYDIPTLAAELERNAFKPSHAQRLLKAFYAAHGNPDVPELRVGRELEAYLASNVPLRQSRVVVRRRAADGTVKLLLGFDGGGSAETVLMPAYDATRAAGCVSSQIGCAMGCDFCASTRGGLERNLTAGEIVEQFLRLREEAASDGRRLATIVFMGMGEPMHNLDHVIPAIRRIAGEGLGGLGGRQITISTVGIVPGIRRLADENLGVHLALSLHAPDDATRAKIVPSNKRYPVAEIMDAARAFQARSKRISTIEYCMLAGVNDSDEQAVMLAGLLDGFRAHVNLIPYNTIGTGLSGVAYRRPSDERIASFMDRLIERNVVVHVRRTRGDDVDAACGQLRQTSLNVVST
jgi:23S rRNA (adenine2503-C2)-methyltransferase